VNQDVIPIDQIQTRISVLRGHRIIMDADLAAFYGVSTKVLNQAVKRNADRFPPDFRFQLTDEEVANLRSQIVTSSSGHGGRRKLPFAFTEHGALVLTGAQGYLSPPSDPRNFATAFRRDTLKAEGPG
jgi:hypothetical protein